MISIESATTPHNFNWLLLLLRLLLLHLLLLPLPLPQNLRIVNFNAFIILTWFLLKMDIFRGTPRIFPDFFFKIYDISKNILVNLQIIFLIVEKNDIFLGSPQIFFNILSQISIFWRVFWVPPDFFYCGQKNALWCPRCISDFCPKNRFLPKKNEIFWGTPRFFPEFRQNIWLFETYFGVPQNFLIFWSKNDISTNTMWYPQSFLIFVSKNWFSEFCQKIDIFWGTPRFFSIFLIFVKKLTFSGVPPDFFQIFVKKYDNSKNILR